MKKYYQKRSEKILAVVVITSLPILAILIWTLDFEVNIATNLTILIGILFISSLIHLLKFEMTLSDTEITKKVLRKQVIKISQVKIIIVRDSKSFFVKDNNGKIMHIKSEIDAYNEVKDFFVKLAQRKEIKYIGEKKYIRLFKR